MVDEYDDGRPAAGKDDLKPLNAKKKPERAVAVAVQGGTEMGDIPTITAAGRGKIAEQILQIAFERGIKVREDATLAEMLAQIELDSPIPSEAFMAIAEILTYVYRANGQPNPFDAVLADVMDEAADNEAADDNAAQD